MKKLAIIRLSALGDIIISSSFLAQLKALNAYEIHFFVDRRFEGVLEDSPAIHKLHSLDFKGKLKSLKGILELRRYLKNCGEFECVIDMQGLIKSALIGKMLKSKTFIGFSKKGVREALASLFYTQKVDISYFENILKRNFEVLFSKLPEFQSLSLEDALKMRAKSIGYNLALIDFSAGGGALNHLKNDENHTQSINSNITTNPASNAISKLKICFILEASIPEKIYPASSFIALATSLSAFAPCEFYLAFKDNRSAASQIQNALKDLSIDVFTLCNLDFNTLKFALSKMHCVIGGDTGLTYLAWLLNTPVISLYGNKIGGKKGSKNMKDTSLERILLGNAYLVSKTNNFEIASIAPADISTLFQNEIYPKIKD